MWGLNSTRLKELLTDLDEEAYFALGGRAGTIFGKCTRRREGADVL